MDKASGILELERNGMGFLRNPEKSLRRHPQDPVISRDLIRRYNIPSGARVSGPADMFRDQMHLNDVEAVCGLPPDKFAKRTRFGDLVTVDPKIRFNLGVNGNESMRILDLLAPIGMGTRALIVSPPRAGKTMLLEAMAQGIRKSHPDVRVIILLVDERPEEVTNFKRSVDAEVFASSNDMDGSAHIRIVELTMTHVRLELECGNHIALLVDSLTRMARAFNLNTPGRGRVMSGGVEAGALETPRRFFGLARTIENGGSITIAASALVDTGSRMDDLIFEEFKGTGNSEIVLDRDLANQRIWPAININESGTRKEELLLHPMEMKFARNLRRELSGQQPGHAVEQLKKIFAKYPTNEELVMSTR